MKRLLVLLGSGCFAVPGALGLQPDGLPANLGRELHPLVLWERGLPRTQTADERHRNLAAHLNGAAGRLQQDAAGRVVVNILLDGTRTPAEVRARLVAMDAAVLAEHVARRANGGDGLLSVRLPLDQAVNAAATPGVRSVVAAHRPWRRTGKVPGQGVGPLHADQVIESGFTGGGITVGVLSDSYSLVSPHAAADVLSGDLPKNVTVVSEGDPNDSSNTDEGRAMLQIVHDVAPGAALAFASVGATQTTFADAIRSLRTGPVAQCDIMVDDIAFPDEPFLSDGIISEAVDEVVTSTVLAGRPAIYYSASGNDGSSGYQADFSMVSDGDARNGLAGVNNLQLQDVPAALTAGGFHNFKGVDAGRGRGIAQLVTVSGSSVELSFQWDDTFNNVTTDYNLLVFNADGTYRPDLSGTDSNPATGEPLEIVDLEPGPQGSAKTYQLVLTRAIGSVANRLLYIADGGTLAGKFLHTGMVPTLFGHPAARNADGVSAFDVHDVSAPENYSSFGPVNIFFDAQGNRLAAPETRWQPDISAVDGVNTTFFPAGPLSDTDYDSDGFPNFYGCSAAAPHAAAVAALLLNAAGGPGSLSAEQMRNLLEASTPDQDLDPAAATATATTVDGQLGITVTATGDDSAVSGADSKFFKLTFVGFQGCSLRKVKIDLGPAGARFDIGAGHPFKIGETAGVAKSAITAKVPGASGVTGPKLTLHAPAGALGPGASVSFGLGREDAQGAAHYSADALAGALVHATVVLPSGEVMQISGAFVNRIGHGYSPNAGYGLINAEAALQMLPGH